MIDYNLAHAAQYKYLGLVLTEHLDYVVTAKLVAQSANKALGLLNAKSKAFGGLQYEPFTKIYESVFVPIISYGAAICATTLMLYNIEQQGMSLMWVLFR